MVRGHAAWALGELARRHPECADEARRALLAKIAEEQDEWVREELSAAIEAVAMMPGR